VRLGKQTIVFFGSQVGSSIAGFLATWYIANQLGSTILGEYTVVAALLFWLNVPASSVGTAMTKRISEGDAPEEFVTAGHLLNVAITAVLVGGILAATDVVNQLVAHDVALEVALLVAVQGVFDVVVSTLQGQRQVGKSGLLKTFERILRSTFQIVVVFVGAAFVWLILGHAGAVAIAAVVGVYFHRDRPAWPRFEHVRRLVTYGMYGWLGTMKSRAFAWMDTLVLGAFAAYSLGALANVTHSQIGIYEVAWSLASVLGLVSVSISSTLFPALSELGSEEDYAEVRHLVDEGLAFSGVFVIPGLFGAVVVGRDLLVIYRAEFAQGATILVVLILARLLSGYAAQFLNAINAIDRPDVTFRINLAFVVLNAVLNVALVYVYGWYGAAAATVLSTAVSVVISAYALWRLVGSLSIPVAEVGYQALAALVMFVVTWVLDPVLFGVVSDLGLSPAQQISAVGIVGVGAGVYALALVVLSSRVRSKARGLAPL
jgi:O-antigen/teichoic acid export membrane protein